MATPISVWWAPSSTRRPCRGKRVHFAVRGYLFIALIALLGVTGTWSDEPALASAWMFPAFLLLAGLAVEAWYMRGTRLGVRMRIDSRLKLGRPVQAAYAFTHNRGRELQMQYARVLPAAFSQSPGVRRVALPAEEELRDPARLMPLRLGAGRFGDLPARLLGRFSLAWWSRDLTQDDPFAVAPDTLPRGARAVPGESAGETPRRLPGVGVELLQLREYVSGDALSRIDWKATARRGSLIAREYSEAQHLEILIVVDASRASRVRAGDLDRLGLYANVAARLAEHAVSVEDRVGLLVYADRTLTACLPDRGMRAVTRLRRALEVLEADRGEPHPVAAAIQVRRMLRHRGLVVWLTDLAEPARNDALMQALKALVPRHQPIVASPHAAEIARLAQAPSREWRDPSISLAAREHQQRAQLQVANMRRQGIVVLDEPDDKLDGAVLDAYLQLRRRRRI
jgi:uncharacterized protein (DUF58 family)